MTKALRSQFFAALDMLERAIVACPEEVWSPSSTVTEKSWQEFWYLTSHTLFWLDFYLHDSPDTPFAPPAPFGLEERDPAGVLPPRVYSKDELLTYLNHGRRKVQAKFDALTETRAQQKCIGFGLEGFTLFELHLYSVRHIQHHAAQLNLLLRQSGHAVPPWVSRGTG